MQPSDMEKAIINNYQRDEQAMILVFAQWCINHGLDPVELYQRAYPQQTTNPALQQAVQLTVPKEESGDIPDETLLNVLSLFGNDDLAIVVTEGINKER